MLPSIIASVKRFLRREDGPTSVEYAVMIMCVLGVVITGVQLLGGGLDSSLEDSSQRIGEATNG